MRDQDRTAAGLLLLAVASCQREASSVRDAKPPTELSAVPAADAPEPPPQPVLYANAGYYSVVQVGALLHRTPGKHALAKIPAAGDRDRVFVGATVRVHGEQAGMLEINTLPPDDTGVCGGYLSGLSDFSIRLFVDREQLVKVTTAPVRHEFDDGTSLALSAGVPLLGTDPKDRHAVPLGAAVDLPVTADKTGDFYMPTSAFALGSHVGVVNETDDPLHYANKKMLAPARLFHAPSGATAHFGVSATKGQSIVVVRNRCLEATVKAAPQRVGPPERGPSKANSGLYAMKGPKYAIPPASRPDEEGLYDHEIWGGNTGIDTPEGISTYDKYFTVAAGTMIYWSDGNEAGVVVGDHMFADPPTDRGVQSCWDVPLIRGRESSMKLCFASRDIGESAGTGRGGRGTGEGTIGLGNVGLIGKGDGSGYGRGSGAGFGGRGKRVPRVRQGKATVTGEMDTEIIRRIVRSHIDEVRYCYNQGLVRDPELAGKITISFVITNEGKVRSADVEKTELSDDEVDNCIGKAFRGWKFPKPSDGGVVSVSYPLTLSPS